MRLLIVLTVLLVAAFCATDISTAAGEGAAVYETLKCGMCHKPDKKAAAVSMAEIAKAYQSRDKLLKFLKGESKPIIESDNYGMMRGQMSKLSALQEQEKEALADYLLSFK